MTEKELSQLYCLNRECEYLAKDIAERRARIGYKSPILSGMPGGGERREFADDIAELADLEAIQSANLRRIQRERERIEKYIGEIEDGETRLIMRLRHVNGMTWEGIGRELNADRRTVSRKYYRRLKDAHNAR
jgi:hypothetical protein